MEFNFIRVMHNTELLFVVQLKDESLRLKYRLTVNSRSLAEWGKVAVEVYDDFKER
jgi:hypothetical protein